MGFKGKGCFLAVGIEKISLGWVPLKMGAVLPPKGANCCSCF